MCTSPSRPFLLFFFNLSLPPRDPHSFPTRRSSDLTEHESGALSVLRADARLHECARDPPGDRPQPDPSEGPRSEEHTSELQSLRHLVCRLLLEKKKNNER